MLYYFVTDSQAATGVLDRDSAPQHVHCEVMLKMEPSVAGYEHHPLSRWHCSDCGNAGWVQFLPAYIERRTRELPDPPLMPDPPASPLDWQDYLDEYFAEGVLFLGVRDEPGYPVRDTSVFVLSDRVHVDLAPGRDPELVLVEGWCDRPHRLRCVRRLSQQAPGVLIVHGPDGKAARLDAHLTGPDKAYVHVWKYTCYCVRQHHCGDESCPYCPDRDAIEPCPYCLGPEPAEGDVPSPSAVLLQMGEANARN